MTQSSVSVWGVAWEGTAPSSVDYSPIFPLTRSEQFFFLSALR